MGPPCACLVHGARNGMRLLTSECDGPPHPDTDSRTSRGRLTAPEHYATACTSTLRGAWCARAGAATMLCSDQALSLTFACAHARSWSGRASALRLEGFGVHT
eukprot:4003760-Prymnesium_polylepis.1